MTGDLFGEPAIAWHEDGLSGTASDGRRVTIEPSVLTGRYIATIPWHGRDVVTRRARKTVAEARAAAADALRDLP